MLNDLKKSGNYFFGNIFQKITKRGQKVKFNPMYLKAWPIFTRKGFGDTEVIWNIVYRSQILVLHFLSLSFHVTLFNESFAPGQNLSQQQRNPPYVFILLTCICRECIYSFICQSLHSSMEASYYLRQKFSVTTYRNLISELQLSCPNSNGKCPNSNGCFLSFYFQTRCGHCLQKWFFPSLLFLEP